MSAELQHDLEERIRRELSHLTAEDRCALVRIIERLVEAYQPDRIYLFGSKARGDYGPDSDFDLMVIVPQTTEPGYRLAQQAHSLLWDIGTAADVMVWSQYAFESRLHLKASLPATIVREGRLLYAG
jgi:predicted nucleotidyltransferase